jgi:hypothetical protein
VPVNRIAAHSLAVDDSEPFDIQDPPVATRRPQKSSRFERLVTSLELRLLSNLAGVQYRRLLTPTRMLDQVLDFAKHSQVVSHSHRGVTINLANTTSNSSSSSRGFIYKFVYVVATLGPRALLPQCSGPGPTTSGYCVQPQSISEYLDVPFLSVPFAHCALLRVALHSMEWVSITLKSVETRSPNIRA